MAEIQNSFRIPIGFPEDLRAKRLAIGGVSCEDLIVRRMKKGTCLLLKFAAGTIILNALMLFVCS